MATDSKIEWTHHTFNPWRGCTKVSPGCDHCYAESLSKRNPGVLGEWGPNAKRVVAAESYWQEPLKWNTAAAAAGERRRVFCASLADVFEDYRGKLLMTHDGKLFPGTMHELRHRLFELIEATPHLDWLLLTKRPHKISPLMAEITNGTYREGWNFRDHLKNVWLGTTVEDQARANHVGQLLENPASAYFFSCEPLLGPVKLFPPCFRLREGSRMLVIAGGESGHHSRPVHPDWIRSLRDQCQTAGVPFFFKQWGDWAPQFDQDCQPLPYVIDGKPRIFDEPTNEEDWPNAMIRVGKAAAGRILDNLEWSQMPPALEAKDRP